MAICHNLFNHMKNGNKISKLIIGLLLELKEVINSKKKKHLIIENLTKIIDNRQNLLTNLKDKNTIMLNELSKMINKDSNKKKKSNYEKNK